MGTLFKITTNSIWTNLLDFDGTNGAGPQAALFRGADRNCYGTATYGGIGFDGQYYITNNGPGGSGNSTLFRFVAPPNPPAIVTQPVSETVYAGNNASFSVTATGDIPLSYFWLRNNAYIPGATNPTVTITNVQLPDSGSQFSCVITNFYGMVTSSVATLTVIAPSTLYSFSFSDGSNPYSGLVTGTDGNLYGTTQNGGPRMGGTVFKITTNGMLTTLAFFNITNGFHPIAGLTEGSDGNFYGTTYSGGDYGLGTIFRMTSSGNLTNLISFNRVDGANPYCILLPWSDGSFYGTTVNGGSSGYGVVFNITTNGQLATLFSFNNTTGQYPSGILAKDPDGYLYGTTGGGGPNGGGSAYKISTTGLFTNIHYFNYTVDGDQPTGGLINASGGNFYGTTFYGGPELFGTVDTYGTVYSISTNGMLKNLVVFDYNTGANVNGPLVQDSYGNLYGTTQSGGVYGDGTVFELANPGSQTNVNGGLTTLLTFAGTNGSGPQGPLVIGPDGALYGTTEYGGNGYNGNPASGYGTIFRVPLIPVARPRFTSIIRLPNGAIQLTITGATGDYFSLMESTNLVNWHTLFSVTNFAGITVYTDQSATSSSIGFYKLSKP